jgi:hypothetical protein
MKPHAKESQKKLTFTGNNLGFYTKILLLIATLTAGPFLAIISFYLFCFIQQSSRQNVIFDSPKNCFTDTAITQALIQNDQTDLSASNRVLNFMQKSIDLFNQQSKSDLEHHKSSNQFSSLGVMCDITGRWLSRILRWNSTLPDYKSINLNHLYESFLKDTRTYNQQNQLASLIMLVHGIYPEHFDEIKQQTDIFLDQGTFGNPYFAIGVRGNLCEYNSDSTSEGVDRLSDSLSALQPGRIGFPYRFMLKYTAHTVLIQLGNQYCLSLELSTLTRKRFMQLQLAIFPLFFMAIIPSAPLFILTELLALTLCRIYYKQQGLRISIGYNPYTVKSELFFKDDSKGVTYNLSNIALNILVNLLTVSLAGIALSANVMIQMVSLKTQLCFFLCALIGECLYLCQLNQRPTFNIKQLTNSSHYRIPYEASSMLLKSPLNILHSACTSLMTKCDFSHGLKR